MLKITRQGIIIRRNSLSRAKAVAVPDDISNVNLFRIVLKRYFDADLPLLENRQYPNKDMQMYYEFQDVTEGVNGQEHCNIK